MFGIVSKKGIKKEFAECTRSAQRVKNGRHSCFFNNGWVFACGASEYEDSNISVIADADIYNRKDLLGLADIDTENDAHLLGALYLGHGYNFLEKLQGPFSLCIADKKVQKVIIATDHFGIRPLVYSAAGDDFIFGESLRSVLSAMSPEARDIDYEAILDYINLSAIPTPKTIFKKIKKLHPGHFISIEKEFMMHQSKKYYDIRYSEKAGNEDYFCERIPIYIEDSVKLILDYEASRRSEVGAFLSGGTDSSTLAGMIRKLSGRVETFSIGFDEPGYNELDYSRIAARHFETGHHEYIVTPEDVLKVLGFVAASYDEPFGNASVVPTYFCARIAKENGVDVLVAGDGGDEIFGGNERYAADRIFSAYHRIPSGIRKALIEPVVSITPPFIPLIAKGRKYIRRANIPQPDRFFSYNPVMAIGKEAIFSPDFLRLVEGYDPVSWARELYNGLNGASELNRQLYIDMKFTITDNDLRKVTTMSEKAGVRVSYPFLDRRLVDFAATIPYALKVKGKRLRYIFKKALANFLPPEIIQKKKHGFGLPIGIWLRTNDDLRELARENLLDSGCSIRPLLRENFMEELFSLHRITGAPFYGDIIWLLLVLELWCKSNKVHLS